jgi:hypothetical protein
MNKSDRRIKNKIKGSRTRNHEIPGAPARQIKFNIQVQNKIYIIFNKNIKVVLPTPHE